VEETSDPEARKVRLYRAGVGDAAAERAACGNVNAGFLYIDDACAGIDDAAGKGAGLKYPDTLVDAARDGSAVRDAAEQVLGAVDQDTGAADGNDAAIADRAVDCRFD